MAGWLEKVEIEQSSASAGLKLAKLGKKSKQYKAELGQTQPQSSLRMRLNDFQNWWHGYKKVEKWSQPFQCMLLNSFYLETDSIKLESKLINTSVIKSVLIKMKQFDENSLI